MRNRPSWQVGNQIFNVKEHIHGSSFLLQLGDQPCVGKVAPGGALKKALEKMGETQFDQVEVEESTIASFPPQGDSHLPVLLTSGLEQGSGCRVMVTAYKGQLTLLTTPLLSLKCTEHLCNAIAYVQARNLAHCDIRPDNIVYDGEVFTLIDFGLACKTGTAGSHEPNNLLFTPTDIIMRRPVRPLADIESLAYSLLKMHGCSLGWEEAAEEHRKNEVLYLRRKLQASPARVLQGLPILTRQFVAAAFAALIADKALSIDSFTTKGVNKDSAKSAV